MTKFFKYFIFIGIVFLFSGCSDSISVKSKPFNSTKHYTQELKAVRREKYKKGKLLNKSELQLLWELEDALKGLDYRIIIQTSLGAFLQHKEKDAFLKINCKRADFVIMNRFGYPEAVIEYNGEGHYSKDSGLRDNIKEIACNSADVPFVVITYKDKNDLKTAVKSKVLPVLYQFKS